VAFYDDLTMGFTAPCADSAHPPGNAPCQRELLCIIEEMGKQCFGAGQWKSRLLTTASRRGHWHELTKTPTRNLVQILQEETTDHENNRGASFPSITEDVVYSEDNGLLPDEDDTVSYRNQPLRGSKTVAGSSMDHHRTRQDHRVVQIPSVCPSTRYFAIESRESHHDDALSHHDNAPMPASQWQSLHASSVLPPCDAMADMKKKKTTTTSMINQFTTLDGGGTLSVQSCQQNSPFRPNTVQSSLHVVSDLILPECLDDNRSSHTMCGNNFLPGNSDPFDRTASQNMMSISGGFTFGTLELILIDSWFLCNLQRCVFYWFNDRYFALPGNSETL